MRVDDFTEARIAEYPGNAGSSTVTATPLESMLRGLNGIWTNTDAAEFAIDSSDRDMLRMASRPWQGAGGPKTMRGYKGTAGGQGEYRTAARFNSRMVTLPLIENTRNKTEKNKLLGLLWPSTTIVGTAAWPQLLVAGFRRETQTNSRYLLDITDEGSFDKPSRGIEADAQSPLKIKSTWPWYVVPRTAASGTPFTPGGEGPEIIWGIRWDAAVSGNIAITVTGNSDNIVSNFVAPTGGWGTPFMCFSPPFRFIEGGAFGSARVPPYLYRDQAYTISATTSPAVASTVFYFENYGSI